MTDVSRRTFIKFVGGSTTALGLGFSGPAWAQTGVAKTKTTTPGMTLETDVAVVGGGCAGLAAAETAAEMGLKVAVFEKQERLAQGGNGPFAWKQAAA
jgi:NADPH-dependent 2,4-dienoyl-CoA reductase/sulfur reductase-like enzyme